MCLFTRYHNTCIERLTESKEVIEDDDRYLSREQKRMSFETQGKNRENSCSQSSYTEIEVVCDATSCHLLSNY
jgi:hypothetical protein